MSTATPETATSAPRDFIRELVAFYHASDYFEQLYDFAVELIRMGKAYVDSLNEEEIREYRGTVTEPGRHSPYRERSIEENLDLFARMRAGELPGSPWAWNRCASRIRSDNPRRPRDHPPLSSMPRAGWSAGRSTR